MAEDINDMKWSLQTSLLKLVHVSTKRLQNPIHSYLFTTSHEDKSAKAQLRTTRIVSFNHQGFTKHYEETKSKVTWNTATPSAVLMQAESYHEVMKRQQRRLPFMAFQGGHGNMVPDMIPRMPTLQSTTALSLATFTSLLIEFVARLDHLFEAAEKLGKVARFKQKITN
jgi:hypothetical protein